MPLRDTQQRADQRGHGGGAGRRTTGAIAAVVVAIVALLGAGGWLYVKSKALRVPTDPTTLCRTDGALPEMTVILLDLSSALSPVQQLDLKNELTRVRDSVPRFGRIEIFAVDDRRPRVVEPILELCNPGRGDDMSALYQNPALALQRWERHFATTLDATFASLLAMPESATSPIFEAVQAAALQTFDAPAFGAAERRRLILVSDLMQNVPGRLDMYKLIPAFDDFERSPYFADVKAKLDGVDVTILYLQRRGPSQRWSSLIAFWSKYFEAQGASVERVLPISGAH